MAEQPSDQERMTFYGVLLAISVSHLLNDTLQSLIPAIYPVVKDGFHLTFAQVGLITLTFQLTASILQPVVGAFTDRRPQPFSLASGMGITLVGLVMLSFVTSYGALLVSVALVGMGSSIFHPESSRIAHLAAGNRRGFAQSFFQVGGNVGSSSARSWRRWSSRTGRGRAFSGSRQSPRRASSSFSVLAGGTGRITDRPPQKSSPAPRRWGRTSTARRVVVSVAILLALIFSKYFYIASMTSYLTFYLIDKFSLSIKSAQLHLFIFQFAVAAGTLIGGPIGDRIGRKYVIWISILGAAPFTLLLPHAGLAGTTVAVHLRRDHPLFGLSRDPRVRAGAPARERWV